MLAVGLFRWVTFADLWRAGGAPLRRSRQPHASGARWRWPSAPVLFRGLNVIPGFYLPSGLLVVWLLLTSYQAVRATYPSLSWQRCLAVELWMFALHFICIFLSIVLGVVLGVVLYQLLF
jgi:hypothetical protein